VGYKVTIVCSREKCDTQ